MKKLSCLSALATALLLLASVAHAATPAMTVLSLTKVSETRITRTDYDYVFQITVKNGAQALRNASETLISVGAGTTIIDGNVQLGTFAANASTTPLDTITLRQNRLLPFNEQALVWSAAGQASDTFSKGADIGWLSEMQAAGKLFYNATGTAQQDVLTTLKENGMDAIRLRVWVNPLPDGNGKIYNDINDVLKRALLAKAAGMKLMIDFHYSDGWADPGQQTKPAAWKFYTQQQLITAVATHTRDSLTFLRNNGITPDWVQVGNETNNGMLWGTTDSTAGGKASASMKNYADLTNSGYDAVKSVFPNALVIVHVSNCYSANTFNFIFGGLKANGGKFDVIGGSDYPTQVANQTALQVNSSCAANLATMATTYNVPVMISEIGVPWDNVDAKAIVADLVTKIRGIPNNRGLGVFYWEPQAYGWKGYSLGAYDASGKPTTALSGFLEDSAAISIKSKSNARCSEVSQNSLFAGAWISGASTCSSAALNQQWILQNMQDDYYRIKASSSGMCIDLASQSTADAINAVQAGCSAATSQQWLIDTMSDGSSRLRSRFSDKCIAVRADTAFVQATCSATDTAQRFILPSKIRIKSVSTGLCSEIVGNSTYSGAWIGGATCSANANQQWTQESMTDPYVRLKVSSTGMCVDLTSQSSADAIYAIQKTCSTGNSQQWKKEPMTDGSYRLRSRYSDKCIAIGAQYGAFQQYTCSGTATNQRFTDF